MSLSAHQRPHRDLAGGPWRGFLWASLALHAGLIWWLTSPEPSSTEQRQPVIAVEIVHRPEIQRGLLTATAAEKPVPARPEQSPVSASAPQPESQPRPRPETQPVAQSLPLAPAPVTPATPAAPAEPAPGPPPGPVKQAPSPAGLPVPARAETTPTGSPADRIGTPSGDDAVAVQPTGGQTDSEEVERLAYQRQLRILIDRHKRYPLMARKTGQQGRVTVAFQLTADGHLIGTKLVRSSGHRLLDRAALAAVKRVDRYPPPPATFAAGTRFRIEVGFLLD